MDDRTEGAAAARGEGHATASGIGPAEGGVAATRSGASLWGGRQGLMLGLISSGIGLHAFNQFAIVAAMPLAAAELGGRDWFSWVYSLYFIGSIAGGTTAASLRDRLGVRLSLGLASVLFAAGGLVALFAPAFGFIIAGRLLQGIADGLIVAICYSLIPANFPSALIARVFAVEATVWAVTALLGPLVGGLIAQGVSWRASFLAVTPLIAALALFTVLTRPKVNDGSAGQGGAVNAGADAPAAAFPPRTIALCVAAAFVLALSSASSHAGWQAATLAAGVAILVIGIRLDGRFGVPLFPAGTFRRGSVLGRGFLILFLMSASHSAGSTYLALLVREVFGLGPAAVGYVVVTMAVTWSAVAMVASRINSLARRHAVMRAGPLFQVSGFMAIALAISLQWLPLVIAGQMLIGTGFGLAWANVNQAAMEAARKTERDRASALLPTMSTAGYAVGAALSGTIATASGLAASLGEGSAGDTATWLYGTAAIGALASFFLGFGVRLRN
ncbi:MFS transporter [Rhizobium sp. NFR07]|uniref:MFS transporter n=1 Tax=Rhizobium sp. NFR07 TaxID=1566262 RepID=UPI0015A5C8D6|nr:MFS transporter [Rhizobium sp. NFR07]